MCVTSDSFPEANRLFFRAARDGSMHQLNFVGIVWFIFAIVDWLRFTFKPNDASYHFYHTVRTVRTVNVVQAMVLAAVVVVVLAEISNFEIVQSFECLFPRRLEFLCRLSRRASVSCTQKTKAEPSRTDQSPSCCSTVLRK
jgi:hypothetical protein